MKASDYPIVIERGLPEDGVAFVAFAPDLPGCMSDGETPEEAAHNVLCAIESWIEAAHELGRPVPALTRQRA